MTISELSEKTKLPLGFAISIVIVIVTIVIYAKTLEAKVELHDEVDNARVNRIEIRLDKTDSKYSEIDAKLNRVLGYLEAIQAGKK